MVLVVFVCVMFVSFYLVETSNFFDYIMDYMPIQWLFTFSSYGLYRIAKMLVLASVRHGNVHGVNVIYDRQALVLFSHSPIMHVQIDTISMIVDYMLSRTTTTTTKAQHTMCGFSCWVYSITSIKTIK